MEMRCCSSLKEEEDNLEPKTKKLLKLESNSEEEEEKEIQAETNRSVELLIKQNLSPEPDLTPKILLNVMIFKKLVDLISEKINSEKIEPFTVGTIIASIFALGDLESMIVMLIIEK